MEMNIDTLMDDLEERMMKAQEHMEAEFAGIRTGKASPSLVENLMIDYYGTQTRLRELAGITSPEARLLVIQPYDPGSVKAIEKAIISSTLGISPINDGRVIRLPIPELSEERRSNLTKQVKTMGEEAKIAIRNIRREGNDFAKKAQKDGNITEDDLKKTLDDIQELTDNYTKEIDSILETKENELMSI